MCLVMQAVVDGAPFVQLAVTPELARAEVRSDKFAVRGPLLDPAVATAMLETGWDAPSRCRRSARCNWWREWPAPFDTAAICHELIALFVLAFDLRETDSIVLEVYPGLEP